MWEIERWSNFSVLIAFLLQLFLSNFPKVGGAWANDTSSNIITKNFHGLTYSEFEFRWYLLQSNILYYIFVDYKHMHKPARRFNTFDSPEYFLGLRYYGYCLQFEFTETWIFNKSKPGQLHHNDLFLRQVWIILQSVSVSQNYRSNWQEGEIHVSLEQIANNTQSKQAIAYQRHSEVSRWAKFRSIFHR